jgi:Beta/Gamma crystallin
MPVTYSLKKQSERDEPRENQAVSEYLEAPGGGGSVERDVSVTYGWEVSGGFELPFEGISYQLGVSYQQSKTFQVHYVARLLPGERARIAYTPHYHVVDALVTKTTGGDLIPNPTGNMVPTQVVTEYEDRPATIKLPSDDGYFHLEYDGCHVYSDNQFGGQAVRLSKRDWDWGSFPNDAISSLRVPADHTLQIFEDTHFTGKSTVFTEGDYGYVGDEWNDRISSIKIW